MLITGDHGRSSVSGMRLLKPLLVVGIVAYGVPLLAPLVTSGTLALWLPNTGSVHRTDPDIR